MWLVLAAVRSGACGYMLRSPAARSYRGSAARMGVSPDRMPSQGMLYDGWGSEQLNHLNNSCALIDKGYDRGLNRFELAVAIAHRAKQSAYAAAEVRQLGAAAALGRRLVPWGGMARGGCGTAALQAFRTALYVSE
jgi:hypothetical protein